MTRWSLVWCTLALAAACGEGPAGPTRRISLDGVWDARFQGTVLGQGTSQTDELVMELRQSGANVTGSIRVRGLDLPVPLSGSVDGERFAYTALASLGPSCDVVVSADTSVDAEATRFTGTQTQSTCEGVAVGRIAATRR